MTEYADSNSDGVYSQAELEALTINQLRELANSLGYTVTATKKADIITQILEQQEG